MDDMNRVTSGRSHFQLNVGHALSFILQRNIRKESVTFQVNISGILLQLIFISFPLVQVVHCCYSFIAYILLPEPKPCDVT